MKFKWRNWNDQLSLLVIILIPGLWVSNHWLQLPEAVVGATILAWGNVLNFYFRKSPPAEPPV